MGAAGSMLIAKGLGKVAGNVFNGRPAFSNLFGGSSRQSTQQYGTPQAVSAGQSVSAQQPKGGLSSMLAGVGDAVDGAVSGVGNLFGGLTGGNTGGGSTQAASSTPSQPKSGLTKSVVGDDGQIPWNSGAEGYTPIHIEQAGPDLFGPEIYNAVK